jgi:endo-1,4-beta-xylanase
MIKRIFFISFVFYFICSFIVEAQEVPSGRRLRDIVADRYGDSIIIGATTGAWLLSSNTGIILDREFSYVTPENDFKQFSIHPDNSSWNWWAADQWVTHIDENEQILRMHCPIGPQCSSWAMNDSRTAEELDTNMCQFLRAVCQRYNGTPGFEYMDVVNETVIDGSWHTDKPGIPDWECPWYKIGLDDHGVPIYIVKAFEIANEYAPDIKFIYNHHEDPYNTASWNLIKQTVYYLKDTLGLRVDGIGWQAHVDVGWEKTASRLEALRALIDWAHSNGLEFHVTEASVWLDGATEEDFEEQAVTYSAILRVLLEKRFTGKVGWNTWHIDDGYGWRIDEYPSLFDVAYEAKPAYYAIQALLESGAGVEEPESNHALKLYNSPNPFILTTSISFEIPAKSYVSLKVYDVSGKEITALVSHDLEVGKHLVEWSASGLPAGIYFCHLIAGDLVGKQKMMLVR